MSLQRFVHVFQTETNYRAQLNGPYLVVIHKTSGGVLGHARTEEEVYLLLQLAKNNDKVQEKKRRHEEADAKSPTKWRFYEPPIYHSLKQRKPLPT